MKKRILILGPLSDSGGREIEAHFMAHTLLSKFDVAVLSTIKMTANSEVLQNKLPVQWTTVDKIISKNTGIALLNLACKYYNGVSEPSYCYTQNKISKQFYNFEKAYLTVLDQEIQKYDALLFTGEFTSKWLPEIMAICAKYTKRITIRITGTIKTIPPVLIPFLPQVDKIILHSVSNSKLLTTYANQNIVFIDQTALSENDLLCIACEEVPNLTYGFLGRFSPEKGIIELVNHFKNLDKKLIIAGDGPLRNQVINSITAHPNIHYIGAVKNESLVDFYNAIDVLIIPSFEEAGPLVGVEAMAAGKIIVSTNVGAMQERLAGTANQFWFDITDENSLGVALDALERIPSALLQKIRQEVKNAYISNYSNATLSRDYLKLFSNY
jgi:glycosyltransferase involved in cell wall biosynthesis